MAPNRPTRRQILASALTASASTRMASAQGQKRPRPNILFAIADDRSWSGAFRLRAGSTALRLPAVERIEREGVRFENSYCAAPSCTPSRSSVLTGRQIWQVEEGGVLYGTLQTKYPVFTHLLEDGGYFVGSTGKTWGPGDWKAAGQTRPPAGQPYNTRKMSPKPAPGIDENDYASNFDDFLAARKPGQPFFFWYGGTEPHRVYENGIGKHLGKKAEDIVEVPPFWPETEVMRNDILDYCAEVEWFDMHLGRMIAALERAGELDNTIVVVTSDNGMPFPRAKVNLYDWGVHMPLAIRWGAKVASPGRSVAEFVHHMDFAPTFLEAAGLPVPSSVTGRSLLPLLASAQPQGRREFVVTGFERHTMCRPDGQTYPMRALRTSRYLYIRNFQPDRWPTGGEFISSNKTTHGDVDACPAKEHLLDPAVRAKYPKQYQLCFGKRPAEELYDLQADPWQMHNVAGVREHASTLKQLRSQLTGYLRDTGDPRVEGRDPWQQYVYHQTTGYGASFNTSLPADVRDKARGKTTHKPE